MKLKFNRRPLLEKVSLDIGLTEVNSPNEILKNILLRGSKKKKQALLAATDIESTIVSSFASGESPDADFSILLPAQRFLEIISAIDSDEIEINLLKNDWAEISLPSAKFKFPCLAGEDFPKIPVAVSDKGFKIAVSQVSGAVSSILNFASDDMVRRNLNGVLIEPLEGNIRFVATDGSRLAYFQKPVSGIVESGFEKLIVPRKAVGEIVKVLRICEKDGADGMAEFSFEKGKAFFSAGETTVISTPIDSSFPDYGRVVPDFSSLEPVLINKTKMLGAVKRVGVFCKETKKIDLKVSPSSVIFTSGETEHGEAREEISPVSQQGADGKSEEVSVSFNPDFLVDSLNFIDAENIEFRPGDGSSPAVISPEGRADFVCILMPVVS